ncbi:hypothetical protein IAT40_003773 [Kwoniella sp. CBS 6097]
MNPGRDGYLASFTALHNIWHERYQARTGENETTTGSTGKIMMGEEAGPTTSTSRYVVDNRYLHAKTLCPLTLRYIGPLPPNPTLTSAASGPSEPDRSPSSTSNSVPTPHISLGGDEQIWLGVEYDNPSHGKGHDGLFKDIRVFQAAEKGSAAFLKLAGRPLLEGNTLVDSIEERYGSILPLQSNTNAQSLEVENGISRSETDPGSGTRIGESIRLSEDKVEDESIVLGSSNKTIIVQAPNFSSVRQRVGQLEKIRNMGFEEEWIACLGADRKGERGGTVGVREELKRRMGGLKWLNLSTNLISTWHEVAEIVDCFTGLEALTLNHSKLKELSTNDIGMDSLQGTFDRIKELHLSDCLLSWDQTCIIVLLFPNLEILHLEANQPLDSLTRPLGRLDKLRELRLGGCPISTWEGVLSSLVDLTALESLDLSFTPIDHIEPSDQRLDSLKSLTMLSSSLRTWSNLDHLSTQFPNLTSLRFSLSEPYPTAGQLTKDEKDLRSICIAKFPHIATFNSTTISSSERRDAELFYVGYVRKCVAAAQSKKDGDASVQKESDWGRWDELSKKHGVIQAEPTKVAKAGLKGKMINLTLHTPDQSDTPPITISILPSAPLSLLHRKITKALNGTPHKRRSGETTSHTLWTVVYPDPYAPGEASAPEKAVRVSAQDDTGSFFKTKKKITPPARDVGWWFVDGDGIWAEEEPPDSD